MRIANFSEYGLAGSVWTADVEQGMAIARRVRTATYAVNQYSMGFMAPFGEEGLEQYTELKAIIAPGSGVAGAA